jgi:hypothetical protein
MGAVISEDVKIEIRNQTDPTWGDSSCGVSSENGQIEGLKNGKRKQKWKNGNMEEWKTQERRAESADTISPGQRPGTWNIPCDFRAL